MSKILVVSTERCGSTNFMKTLELTQNGKFWEHPIFNDFKSQIDNIGFREFMDKSYQLSDFMGTKIVYKNNDMFVKDLIDYHDKVFISLHIANETDIFHEATDISVKALSLDKLKDSVVELREINNKLTKLVDRRSILTYEKVKNILVGKKVNIEYTQIENINELLEEYKLNKEFYTYDY